MAKVKNQIYEGSEESYIDADGHPTYFGELIRQTITDAYPLPSLNPVGIVRKSPRSYKPTQQGRGSPAQAPWRECFQQCTDRWDEMPDVDPAIGPCPEITSKARVWAAKQEQGVMCSYYDLYMAACLSFCTEISVTGPDGTTYKGGTIPSDEGFEPIPSPCKSSDLSVGHTTQQQAPNETQSLHAADSVFGDEVPCCPTGDISWEITEGAGELEPDSGQAVDYTAPETNEDCLNNPTIKVKDCCDREAELKIAINTDESDEVAYSMDIGECEILCNCTEPGWGQMCDSWAGFKREFFTCAGVHKAELDVWYLTNTVGTILGDCSPESMCMYAQVAWCEEHSGEDLATDLRSDDQLSAGCCPAALL